MRTTQTIETERLGLPIAFKFAGAPAEGVIDGYAATFGGMADSYGDVIAPHAFAVSIAEHRAAGTAPAMLWSHDPQNPIGTWTDIREDSRGLRVTGKLTLAVPRAREARALASDGALALSIGYSAREAENLPGGNRLLKSIQLHEISPVALPANTNARILSVKSAIDPTDMRALEQFLRDSGFSRAVAKTAISHGFKAALRVRDVPDGDDLLPLLDALKSGALAIQQVAKGK